MISANFASRIKETFWFDSKFFETFTINNRPYILSVTGSLPYASKIFGLYDLKIPRCCALYKAMQDRDPKNVPWNYTFLDSEEDNLVYRLAAQFEQQQTFSYQAALDILNKFKKNAESAIYYNDNWFLKNVKYYNDREKYLKESGIDDGGSTWYKLGRFGIGDVVNQVMYFPNSFKHFEKFTKQPHDHISQQIRSVLNEYEGCPFEVLQNKKLKNLAISKMPQKFYKSQWGVVDDELHDFDSVLIEVSGQKFLYGHAQIFYAKIERPETDQKTQVIGDGRQIHARTRYYKQPVPVDERQSFLYGIEERSGNRCTLEEIVSHRVDENFEVLRTLLKSG